MITMCLLEGLTCCNQADGAKEQFKEVQTLVNDGILYLENGDLKLPVNGDTFLTVILSNTSTRMFAQNIVKLSDVIFRHHKVSDDKRGRFKEYPVTMYQEIMTKLRKRSNMSTHEINSLQKKLVYGMKIGFV